MTKFLSRLAGIGLLLAATLTLAGCSDEPVKTDKDKKPSGSQAGDTTAKPAPAEKSSADKTSDEHTSSNQSASEERR